MKNTQNIKQLKITEKHKIIIKQLIRFKYLNRIQIQKFLKHKQFNRVIVWLNELTKERYIARDFERKFGNRPAIYCLDIKSKELLRKEFKLNPSEVRRVYQDKHNSIKYKNHLVFLADIYLSLEKFCKTVNAKLTFYTKTELNKTAFLIYPYPDSHFAIENKNKNIKRYFLEIFDPSKNLKWPHKRIGQFFDYFDKEIWQSHTTKPFPEIILIANEEEDKIDLEKSIKKELSKRINDVNFYLSSWEEIIIQGMTSKALQKVEIE